MGAEAGAHEFVHIDSNARQIKPLAFGNPGAETPKDG